MQCLDIGVGKANSSALKIFLMGVLGGAFVSIGGFLALTVGMNCPGIASANPGLQKMIFGAFGMLCALSLSNGRPAYFQHALSGQAVGPSYGSP